MNIKKRVNLLNNIKNNIKFKKEFCISDINKFNVLLVITLLKNNIVKKIFLNQVSLKIYKNLIDNLDDNLKKRIGLITDKELSFFNKKHLFYKDYLNHKIIFSIDLKKINFIKHFTTSTWKYYINNDNYLTFFKNKNKYIKLLVNNSYNKIILLDRNQIETNNDNKKLFGELIAYIY